MPQPGTFGSDWQLRREDLRQKSAAESRSKVFPIVLDRHGHPVKAVQLGSRRRGHFK